LKTQPIDHRLNEVRVVEGLLEALLRPPGALRESADEGLLDIVQGRVGAGAAGKAVEVDRREGVVTRCHEERLLVIRHARLPVRHTSSAKCSGASFRWLKKVGDSSSSFTHTPPSLAPITPLTTLRPLIPEDMLGSFNRLPIIRSSSRTASGKSDDLAPPQIIRDTRIIRTTISLSFHLFSPLLAASPLIYVLRIKEHHCL
jgi:hypothetical protein